MLLLSLSAGTLRLAGRGLVLAEWLLLLRLVRGRGVYGTFTNVPIVVRSRRRRSVLRQGLRRGCRRRVLRRLVRVLFLWRRTAVLDGLLRMLVPRRVLLSKRGRRWRQIPLVVLLHD